FVADIAYIGNHGVHQPLATVLNDPTRVSAAFNLPVFFTPPSQATLNSLGVTQQILVSGTNAFTAAGFTNPILVSRPDGTSKYNGVTLKVTQRFTKDTNVMGQYTYSDVRTDSTGTVLDLGLGRQMEQAPWGRK